MVARPPAPVIVLVAAFALALSLAACGGKGAAAPRTPAAPALFGWIPDDTPYVLASFEAIPLEALARYRDLTGNAFREALEHPEGEELPPDATYARFVGAFLAEFEGKWNAAGVESLGLSATPRFALYGLGLSPVLRIEIRDGTRLLGTIQRIAKRAGYELPPPTLREGRRFWRIDAGERVVVIAITSDQFVVAFGPTDQIDPALPQLLGLERPARSMAGGGELAAMRAKHRLGSQAVALVDSRRLVTRLLAGAAPSQGCSAEIDRLASRVPRFAAGYEIRPTAHDGALVFELAPDLIAELRAMRVELPGLAEAAAERPLFMFAAGLDLRRAQGLAVAAAESIARAAVACNSQSAAAAAGILAQRMAEPLPAMFGRIRGLVLSVASVEMAPPPLAIPPRSVEGFALVSSAGAAQLLEVVRMIAGQGGSLELPADGKLHRIPGEQLPLQLPFPVFAGATPSIVGIAAGTKGPARAERALSARPTLAPLLTGDADYGRILELRSQLGRPDAALDRAQSKLYGRARGTVDVTDHGVEVRSTIESR